MALINVTPAEYTPAEHLALVYKEGTQYWVKDSSATVSEINVDVLKLLGVDPEDLPAVVFYQDVENAKKKTVADVSNVTVARAAKASTAYVQQVAGQKVDKEVFASAVSAIDLEVTALQKDVADIKEQLGGSGESQGGSLIDRVANLQKATVVEVSKDTPILTTYGEGQAADNKVAATYLPDVALKGSVVSQGIGQKINFVGNCNITRDAAGNITIRIGDNLNSSCFNNTDSKETVGTASASYATSGVNKTLADGTKKSIALLGDNTVTIITAGKIHFDNIADNTFVVTVGSKSYTFGPVTANGYYTAGATAPVATAPTAEAYLYVSNLGAEAKTEEGATGYSGNIQIKIFVHDLEFADGYVTFSVKQTGTEGSQDFTVANAFYLVNDTTTKANATAASVTLTSTSAKTLSGVSYITAGTVSYSATVENVGNPATYNQNNSPVSFTNNTWANSASADVAYNATSASKTTTTLKSGQFADPSVTVSAKNINGQGTTATAKLGKAILIDTTAVTASTATVEYFDTEAKRLKEDFTAWSSADSLADGAAGAEGLMVCKGYLCYPAGNYTGTNDGFNSIVGSNQPDYSACTGNRTYVRNFNKPGDIFGGTIQIKSNKAIGTLVANGVSTSGKEGIKVQIYKPQADGSVNAATAYDIGKTGANGGIGTTASSFGTTASSGVFTNKFVFSFTDGKAADNIWVKITMTPGAGVNLTEMSFI